MKLTIFIFFKQNNNMGITTHLVHVVLFSEMFAFLFLILPFPKELKKRFIKAYYTSKALGNFTHILYVIYLMIVVMFVDSAYKIYKGPDVGNLYAKYHTERNIYLSGITLFLALIYKIFTNMLSLLFKEEDSAQILKKQSMNQKSFVQGIVDDGTKKDKKILEQEEMIAELNKKLRGKDILIKQLKNNQGVYGELMDKYNELKNQMNRESKKTK